MKLNDFFNKKVVKRVKKEASIFNLSNEKIENDLGQRINELEDKLKKAHAEINNLEPFKHKYTEASNVLETKDGAIARIQDDFNIQTSSLDNLRTKVNDLQDYKNKFEQVDSQYNSSISEVHNLKKELEEDRGDIENLKADIFNARESRSNTEAVNVKLNNDLEVLKDSFSVIRSKNGEFQEILIELTEKYKNTVEDNKTLELDCQALLNDNRSARLKIEELDSFKVQLNEWNKKLSLDSAEATTKSSALNKKLTSRDGIIQDMNTYIAGLIKDRDDLVTLTNWLKHELRKPRYSPSTTFLSRKIGMPTSKQNIRTEYLGTGSPTMLKFAVKEEAHA